MPKPSQPKLSGVALRAYDAQINAEEQSFRAGLFRSRGDLTVIRDLHGELQRNYNAAALKYVGSKKSLADKALYMNERSNLCGRAFEGKLLKLRLIRRTLTEPERLAVDMVSWLVELEITTELVVKGEGESCGPLLALTRQYLHHVNTVLGVPSLQAVGDLAPLAYSSAAHEAAYTVDLVPYVATVFTKKQIDNYEADKNYTLR